MIKKANKMKSEPITISEPNFRYSNQTLDEKLKRYSAEKLLLAEKKEQQLLDKKDFIDILIKLLCNTQKKHK